MIYISISTSHRQITMTIIYIYTFECLGQLPRDVFRFEATLSLAAQLGVLWHGGQRLCGRSAVAAGPGAVSRRCHRPSARWGGWTGVPCSGWVGPLVTNPRSWDINYYMCVYIYIYVCVFLFTYLFMYLFIST